MSTAAVPQRVRKEMRPWVESGWALLQRRRAGHPVYAKGNHRVNVASSPSDVNWARQANREFERCQAGGCDCNDAQPASFYDVKATRRLERAGTHPEIVSSRRTEGGRVAVKVRHGEMSWELIFDPTADDIWGGFWVPGDGTLPVEVVADLEEGELHIGSIPFRGLPLGDLRKHLNGPATVEIGYQEALALSGLKRSSFYRYVGEGVIVRTRKVNGKKAALFDKSSVEALVAARAGRQRAKPNMQTPKMLPPAPRPAAVAAKAATPAPIDRLLRFYFRLEGAARLQPDLQTFVDELAVIIDD